MQEEEEDTQPIKYEVYVDDNFHYMDKSERYKLNTFETCEEAIAACMKKVDESLEEAYEKGMSLNMLIELYVMFGEDPFIISKDKTCFFSGRDYARKRAAELCAPPKEGVSKE